MRHPGHRLRPSPPNRPGPHPGRHPTHLTDGTTALRVNTTQRTTIPNLYAAGETAGVAGGKQPSSKAKSPASPSPKPQPEPAAWQAERQAPPRRKVLYRPTFRHQHPLPTRPPPRAPPARSPPPEPAFPADQTTTAPQKPHPPNPTLPPAPSKTSAPASPQHTSPSPASPPATTKIAAARARLARPPRFQPPAARRIPSCHDTLEPPHPPPSPHPPARPRRSPPRAPSHPGSVARAPRRRHRRLPVRGGARVRHHRGGRRPRRRRCPDRQAPHRAGMGWCQGRVCGYAVACLARGQGADADPPTEADLLAAAKRPLARPVPLGVLADQDRRNK